MEDLRKIKVIKDIKSKNSFLELLKNILQKNTNKYIICICIFFILFLFPYEISSIISKWLFKIYIGFTQNFK